MEIWQKGKTIVTNRHLPEVDSSKNVSPAEAACPLQAGNLIKSL